MIQAKDKKSEAKKFKDNSLQTQIVWMMNFTEFFLKEKREKGKEGNLNSKQTSTVRNFANAWRDVIWLGENNNEFLRNFLIYIIVHEKKINEPEYLKSSISVVTWAKSL